MKKKTVQKPRCATCTHRLTYMETLSRREGGLNLQFGREYCTAGKKYHMFRSKDPKTYPPSWCPKIKNPAEFRIYTFKDTDSWYLHYLVKPDAIPMSYQCAVRTSGTVELTPASFYSLLEEKSATELLGVPVKSGEIVEIDDGLKPYCFYIKLDHTEILPYWNPEVARNNEYHRDKDDK